ncbi:LamG domain-containing protein [Staphylococcus delphini]|uniref:LamG domain-containing protein n=1 Tax=Staphylococcus delphini TaxID=53344 RepID=UPI0021D32117|nr:LamG domain-containing protein [Staphylococcus delphini]UXS43727.1 LamG domain-containing protein [Staphylococcus delphini]UXV46328.1 LamG domain-containing protein [Staphylococcus delphini]
MTKVKLGDKNIPFIYQGNELLYPNPIKDGLVLWYDFKGMSNSDTGKDIAEDLSGNNNDGTLFNLGFNTNGSGYNDGLYFDGVDDYLELSNPLKEQKLYEQTWTVSIVVSLKDDYPKNPVVNGINKGLEIRNIYNQNKVLNFISNSSTTYLYSTKSIEKNKKNHITYTFNYLNRENSIYINGELDSRITVEENYRPDGMLNLLGISPQRNNVIYSLVIYNRALTDQEVQHNYKLEKERWGL